MYKCSSLLIITTKLFLTFLNLSSLIVGVQSVSTVPPNAILVSSQCFSLVASGIPATAVFWIPFLYPFRKIAYNVFQMY